MLRSKVTVIFTRTTILETMDKVSTETTQKILRETALHSRIMEETILKTTIPILGQITRTMVMPLNNLTITIDTT